MPRPRVSSDKPLDSIHYLPKQSGTTARKVTQRDLHPAGLAQLLQFVETTDGSPQERTLIRALDQNFLWLRPHGVASIGSLRDQDAAAIATLKRRLLQSFSRFVDTGFWRAPIDGPLTIDQVEVWDPSTVPGLIAPPGLQMDFSGPAPAAFWFTVAAVMEGAGHLMRRCPRQKCQRLFVRRGRADYCSTRCNQADRAAQNYQKNRDKILEQRHKRYEKRITQKLPKAKVARRSRAKNGTETS